MENGKNKILSLSERFELLTPNHNSYKHCKEPIFDSAPPEKKKNNHLNNYISFMTHEFIDTNKGKINFSIKG